jgi:hypothetical protein
MAFWRRTPQVQAVPLYRLADGGRMQVRGEASYQQQLHRACAGGKGVPFTDQDDCWDRAFSVTVCLRPEPTNPYDRNAVAVHIAGDCVGYLPRQYAPRYQQLLSYLEQRGQVGWVPGRIVKVREAGNYAIYLHLGTPDDVWAGIRSSFPT